MSAGGAVAWAATSPTLDDCGTRRDSEQRRGSDVASVGNCPQNVLQNEERGMSRANEGSVAPERAGGRTELPKPSDQVPTVPSRSDRPSKRGGDGVSCKFCLLCDKFSLDHDRLAVMHQPIDHGGGQCVVHSKIAPNSGRLGWWKPQSSRIHTGRRRPGTTYLHRVCRWEDNPVPDRGEKALKTTNKVRHGELSSQKGGQCK